MTTTKTYRVSDGYGIKTFTDFNEARAYVMDVFEGFRAEGMTRVEAMGAIEVKTTTVEVENAAEFMGLGMALMKELDEDEAPKPKGLSKAMQEALDGMMWKYNKAQGTTFETWYMGHPKHYQTWLDEHTERFGERRTNNIIERQRRTYEDAVSGIVVTGANLGTLTALERRGIVEILTPSSNGHRVKLLNV